VAGVWRLVVSAAIERELEVLYTDSSCQCHNKYDDCSSEEKEAGGSAEHSPRTRMQTGQNIQTATQLRLTHITTSIFLYLIITTCGFKPGQGPRIKLDFIQTFGQN